MMPIHIVVPCYNEAKRLDTPLFLGFAAEHRDIHLTMVDDGSSDDTPNILHSLEQTSGGRIQRLLCPENGGKSEAVRRGMRHVIESEPGCLAVGFLDADLSAPLESCLILADVLDRNPNIDVVFGSRMSLAGRKIQRQWLRRWLGLVFSSVASQAIGLPLNDTQCGAKLFRVTPALKLALENPFRSRWIFDVELLGRILANSPRPDAHQAVYEMPLDQWREVVGSKLKPTDFLRAIHELGAIAWAYRRGQYVVDATTLTFPAQPAQDHQPQDTPAEDRKAA